MALSDEDRQGIIDAIKAGFKGGSSPSGYKTATDNPEKLTDAYKELIKAHEALSQTTTTTDYDSAILNIENLEKTVKKLSSTWTDAAADASTFASAIESGANKMLGAIGLRSGLVRSLANLGKGGTAAYKNLTKMHGSFKNTIMSSKIAKKAVSGFAGVLGGGSGAAGASASSVASAASAAAIGLTAATVGLTLFAVAIGVAIGIAAKLVQMSFQFAKTFDSVSVQFNKATGASHRYRESILAVETRNFQFGVTLEKVSEALQGLEMEFNSFYRLNRTTQESLIEASSLFSVLGVNSTATAKSFQIMNKVMGVTASKVPSLVADLFGFAQAIDLPPNFVIEQFGNAGNTILSFGRDAGKVFKDLMVVSKATGLSLESLLSVAEGFDTFDQAGEKVGRLNALLGGPFLNSLTMITSEPAERIEMLRESLLGAGLDFDNLNFIERKFWTEASGLKDAGELALLLSDDYDMMTKSIEKQSKIKSKDIVQLKKETAQYRELGDYFTQIGRALSSEVLIPLIPALKETAMIITNNIGAIKSMARALVDLLEPLIKKLLQTMSAVVQTANYFGFTDEIPPEIRGKSLSGPASTNKFLSNQGTSPGATSSTSTSNFVISVDPNSGRIILNNLVGQVANQISGTGA